MTAPVDAKPPGGFSVACPAPHAYDRIVLGHGSGGTLSAALVRDVFLRVFDDPVLRQLEDQATVAGPPPGARIAVTTDAFVVSPSVFPGGDVGSLAVAGSVNDLAVGGAIPKYLTAAFVLEEGTSIEQIERVARSMARTAASVPIALVAADTKVVERGKGDGVFIATTAVGFVPPGRLLGVGRAQPGDEVIVSGPIGDHGIAVMSIREGISFDTELTSDVAPVHELTERVLESCPDTRCMRDPTRGGVASALNEIAEASRVSIRIDEAAVPVRREVRAACELLGLDPLYVACEGRFLAIVPEGSGAGVLHALRATTNGREASIIGRVGAGRPGQVTLRLANGAERFVLRLAGEQLPRIC